MTSRIIDENAHTQTICHTHTHAHVGSSELTPFGSITMLDQIANNFHRNLIQLIFNAMSSEIWQIKSIEPFELVPKST